jgi:hypothetical protein
MGIDGFAGSMEYRIGKRLTDGRGTHADYLIPRYEQNKNKMAPLPNPSHCRALSR